MKLIIVSATIMLAAALASASALDSKGADSLKQQEMIKRAMEMIVPGAEHKMLEQLSGPWSVEIKTWPAPGKPYALSKATAMNEVVLGGRFLKTSWQGTMMGMPVENLTMLGFDRRNKKYTAVVFDTFGTYYVTAKGVYDTTNSTITMTGSEEKSAMGQAHEFDFVLTFESENSYVWSVIFRDPVTSSGTGNFKMMELTFKRADGR